MNVIRDEYSTNHKLDNNNKPLHWFRGLAIRLYTEKIDGKGCFKGKCILDNSSYKHVSSVGVTLLVGARGQ